MKVVCHIRIGKLSWCQAPYLEANRPGARRASRRRNPCLLAREQGKRWEDGAISPPVRRRGSPDSDWDLHAVAPLRFLTRSRGPPADRRVLAWTRASCR